MSYYFAKKLSISFNEAKSLITERLKEQGFGILTEIDMKATMKAKLNEDIPDYTILGACNPSAAFKSMQAEERIGLMLPCNVIIRRISDKKVEVAAIDPIATMMSINNLNLGNTAHDVQAKLKEVIENL